MKRRLGKQAKGYVRGDALGNFMLAFWGARTLSPEKLGTKTLHVRQDPLRQFLYVQCYNFPLRHDSPQVRFYTCKELVTLALDAIKWNRPADESSADRQMRSVCRQLGILLKKAPLGRRAGN
jgi:hypothetical protein